MWVILEGVDGSGKSTLADLIAAELPDAVRTHLGAPKSPATSLSECIDDDPFSLYRPGGGIDVISDRHHWGCPVYGPVFRPDQDSDGYGDIGKAGWRYSELFIASRGGTTVYVDVSATTAQERVLHRGDENYDVSALIHATPELLARYHWLLSDAPTLGLHVVEPAKDVLPLLATDIIRIAQLREEEAAPLAGFSDYVGTPTPNILYVCEPTKDARMKIIGDLCDGEWMNTGFCSSARPFDALHALAATLGSPQVVGVGTLPSDADAFIYDMGRI